jgi:uncharacterized protein YjbI with pentapeptide repeats
MTDTVAHDPMAPVTFEAIGPGPDFKDASIWLPQLFFEAARGGKLVIENMTFTKCLIEGPAVLLPVEGCNFNNCNMGEAHGDPRNLMVTPMGPKRVTGPIPFKNCRFDDCRFLGVGFTGSSAFLNDLVEMLGGAPA